LYEFKFFGKPDLVLGMIVRVDDEKGTTTIDQRVLIDKMLKKYKMDQCTLKYTPIPPGLDRVAEFFESQLKPISDNEEFFMRDKNYLSLLGSLNHVALGTRPDIAYSVALLQRHSNDPRPIHWRTALHILAYLKATIDYSIMYHRKGQDEDEKLIPKGYTDASHTDVKEENGHATRKSTMGYIFTLAGGAVSWSSVKQRIVALSTTEAEYLSGVHAGKQAIWMFKFLRDVKVRQPLPYSIFVDNMSAIALTEETTKHARTKHFDTNWAWIRECVRERELEFRYIPSDENAADILTKPLGRTKVEQFVREIGLCRT
jgi:hypothetical protein